MIVKTNIDEDTIEGLVKDVVIKRLSSEIYNRNFQNFTISCEKPTPLGVGWIALYLKNNSK